MPPEPRSRPTSPPLTCTFSTFAQVLPGFQGDFELSFPQVTALRALWIMAHVSVSPHSVPALLWVFANQEAQGYACQHNGPPEWGSGTDRAGRQGRPGE